MKELTTNYEVTKGDLLQFEFTIQSLWSEESIRAAIDKIQADSRLNVTGYEIVKHDWKDVAIYGEYGTTMDKLIIKAEVLQNPFPVMVLVALILASSGLCFLFLSLDKIYLIGKGVAETIEKSPIIAGGLSLGALAILGMGVFWFVFKR